MKLPRRFYQPLAVGAPEPYRELPVQVERDDRADVRLLERLQERVEPSGLHERVAVQEAEVPPAGSSRALVRPFAEPTVRLVDDQPRAGDLGPSPFCRVV